MALIQYLTAIEFEAGIVADLERLVRGVGITRALLVTDPGLAAGPIVPRVTALLGGLAVATFAKTPSNPTESAVLEAVTVYAEHDCDGIVALGGGSPIDLAKAMALVATHDGPLEQFALIRGGLARITSRVAPVVAIPTTAGTGSEVGRAALITLADGRKLGLVSPHLIPRLAVCDPALTVGLPPQLTAATGMDALTHCIETYLSPRVNPPADAIALDGAARAVEWIEPAYRRGDNIDARWNMMMASLQGGLTFQKGLGAVHSMSHPLGGLRAISLHHGTLNAVILPAVLRFNAVVSQDKLATLAARIGVDSADAMPQFITSLNRRLGLPSSLREMGVTEAMVEQVIDDVVADHSTPTNPRPVTRADFVSIFEDAMSG